MGPYQPFIWDGSAKVKAILEMNKCTDEQHWQIEQNYHFMRQMMLSIYLGWLFRLAIYAGRGLIT